MSRFLELWLTLTHGWAVEVEPVTWRTMFGVNPISGSIPDVGARPGRFRFLSLYRPLLLAFNVIERVAMSRRIATSRDLVLLGYPTKEQTLALVGWLALCNAFGRVTADDPEFRCEALPLEATHWVGSIMAVSGRGHRNMTAERQNTVADRKRKVAARRAVGRSIGGLAT